MKKLHLLSVSGGIFALLLFALLVSGCQDTSTGIMPDLSQYSVLLYTDSWNYREGSPDFAAQALEGLNVTDYDVAHNPTELANFYGNSYDLIVFDNSWYGSSVMVDALLGYLENEGRLVMTSWLMAGNVENSTRDPYPSHPIWAYFGYSPASFGDVAPVYKWPAEDALFTFPNSVPDFSAMTDGSRIDTFPGNAESSEEARAGVSSSPTSEAVTIVDCGCGRHILNAFLLCNAIDENNVPNDVDGDGKADAVELWQNEIVAVMQGEITPAELPANLP